MDAEDQMARALDEWQLRRGTRDCKHRPEERSAAIIKVRTKNGQFYTWTLVHPYYYIEAGMQSDTDLGNELKLTGKPEVFVLEEYVPGNWTPDKLYEKTLAYYENSHTGKENDERRVDPGHRVLRESGEQEEDSGDQPEQ